VHLRLQYLFNPDANFVVLHKLATVGGGQTKIDRFDEAYVIFQISAEDLFRQFIGLQASLSGDLSQSGFLFGLKTYFHGHSLGRFASAVKRPPSHVSTSGTRGHPPLRRGNLPTSGNLIPHPDHVANHGLGILT